MQSFPTDMEIQDNCTLGLQQGLIEGGFLRIWRNMVSE